jgi:putative acetyltransferase
VSAQRSDGVVVRASTPADAPAILALYRDAAAGPGGLARRPAEMDLPYVEGFLAKAAVALGAWSPDGALVAEIHAGRIGPDQFAHVLTDLTVAVSPSWQGRGLGSRLFRALFEAARAQGFERVELMAREGNAEAIRLYERLGFRVEGRFEGRVRMPVGTAEADIAMGMRL